MGRWLLLVGLLGALGCRAGDDGAQLRALVERGARAAEAKDVGAILEETVGAGFRADPGGLEGVEVAVVLGRALRRFGEFRILHPRPLLEVKGETAGVRVPFVVLRAGQEPPALGALVHDPVGWFLQAREVADPYSLEMTLRKVEGRWRVERAEVSGTRGWQGF